MAFGRPMYVVEKDARRNRVVVGQREDLLALGLEADEATWLVEPPSGTRACEVKVRSNAPPVPGLVSILDERRFRVDFQEPQFAVSPGQAAVIYEGQEVLGGGWISTAIGAG